jgi:inorganic pyrophosphatase
MKKRASNEASGKNKKNIEISQFRPHPWHGLEVGPEPPEILNAYIEITPFDLVKYEVDKASGYLHVDRPQRSSAQHPTLYGFIPRTYCHERVPVSHPGPNAAMAIRSTFA